MYSVICDALSLQILFMYFLALPSLLILQFYSIIFYTCIYIHCFRFLVYSGLAQARPELICIWWVLVQCPGPIGIYIHVHDYGMATK